VGHLSKACKSRPRCLFCGKSAHDSPELCPLRQAPPKCINCKGDHLATSHDCSKVIEHKMAHSLAATKNISFTDALRSVNSSSSSRSSPLSSSPPSFSDPRLDFHNFPLLPKTRFPHSLSPVFSANRFSPLANLSPAPGNSASPFSSILKHSTPALSDPRTHPGPRNKRSGISSTASSPPSSFPVSAYPKAHRDLLLEPHGPPLPLSEDLPSHSPSLSPHFSNCEIAFGRSETPLDEVIQLLSHHTIMLQHLFNTLSSPYPIPNFNPSHNLRPASSTYDVNFPPLRAQDSHSPP